MTTLIIFLILVLIGLLLFQIDKTWQRGSRFLSDRKAGLAVLFGILTILVFFYPKFREEFEELKKKHKS